MRGTRRTTPGTRQAMAMRTSPGTTNRASGKRQWSRESPSAHAPLASAIRVLADKPGVGTENRGGAYASRTGGEAPGPEQGHPRDLKCPAHRRGEGTKGHTSDRALCPRPVTRPLCGAFSSRTDQGGILASRAETRSTRGHAHEVNFSGATTPVGELALNAPW